VIDQSPRSGYQERLRRKGKVSEQGQKESDLVPGQNNEEINKLAGHSGSYYNPNTWKAEI
jgi:hypothetical protein